jgi:serine/threonine protein kinase
MHSCLSQELINRYKEGKCTANECLRIKSHIAECEKCRQAVRSTEAGEQVQLQSRESASSETGEDGRPAKSPAIGDESPTKSMPGLPDSLVSAWVSGKDTGLRFENYEVLEELPQGGQAVVYKAVHKPTKTHVAVKILLPTLVASTRARYYFEREAEVIASLDHPNIVRIRDSGIIHGQYFFVMEYIKGQPLYRHVEAQNLSFRERIVLFNKICGAVTYAHQHGVIHRDLKSGNILVDERGEPHILDFGLAKAIGLGELAQKDAMPTITGQWSGSLSNMSPEQAAAKPELIDVRTDVYALGMMLYRILTGQYPYDITGPVLEVLRNIQGAEPVRPSKIIRKFDPDAEAILLTALAKDRAQRYQSVASLQDDIENWLAGRPIHVRSISTIYLLRKIIVRHRYTSAVAGLLLLIILSFAYVSFDLYLSAEKARQEAEAIAKQWSLEGARLINYSQQLMPLAFAKFLQEWREGNYRHAHAIARYLKDDSKEKKAASFLLDQRELAEKYGDFRKGFSEQDTWFVDFVLGEHYLKEGNKEKAHGAYRRSYQALMGIPAENKSDIDKFLEEQIKSNLYELRNVQSAETVEPASSIKKEN